MPIAWPIRTGDLANAAAVTKVDPSIGITLDSYSAHGIPISMGKTETSTDWCVGDIVLFSGKSPFSRLIRVGTCSKYSHVAIVARVGLNDMMFAPLFRLRVGDEFSERYGAAWKKRNLLFESTTLNETPCEIFHQCIEGTQSHDLEASIAAYEGRVWRQSLRLQWQPKLVESRRLTRSLLDNLGIAYDMVGAGLTATRILKWFGCSWRTEDRSTMLCVEYVAQAIKDMFFHSPHCVDDLHPGKMTPKQLTRWAMRRLYLSPVRVK